MMEHEGKFCRIGSKLRFCHAAVLRQQAATKENGEGIMNIGYLESIFSFLGGLGMFLYGMSIMGDGMQKSAGSKLVQLYAAPEILASVERQDSILDLLRVILMFSLGMLLVSTVKTYFAYSAQLRRIAVRSVLIDRVIEKACTMSYCLCSDSKAIEVKNGAYMAVGDNNSGTEHIWVTLETLLSGVGCFAVYLTLLTDLNPVLAVMVIAMALVGYLVTRRDPLAAGPPGGAESLLCAGELCGEQGRV